MSPYWTYKALREYKYNLKWRGMAWLIRAHWKKLLFEPEKEYQVAANMSMGGFT